MKTAHAMDSAARGSGGGAKVNAGKRGAVGRCGEDGTGKELPEGGGAAGDIAAGKVGVPCLEAGGAHDVACEDAIPETGGESLDLPLDAAGHVEDGAEGDVAVGPEGVLAGGGAGGIEEGVLRGEDEGMVRDAAAGDGSLRCGDFLRGAADMYSAGPAACGVEPGDGAIEGVVDLEDAGSVSETPEGAAIVAGKPVAREPEELPGGDIEEDRAGGREIGKGTDGGVALNPAAGIAKACDEGGGDGLGAAAGKWPAGGVAHHAKDEADGA